MQRILSPLTGSLLIAATLAYGQTAQDPQSGWKRVGDAPSASGQYPPSAPPPRWEVYPNAPDGNQAPYNDGQGQFGNAINSYPRTPDPRPPAASAPIPSTLRVPAGTFITVRTNGEISSDRNHPGDAFSVTLAQPLVVNGVVIAEPGQTVSGQVVEAQRAGRIEGTAKLRVQLTELTLVDGQQIPIRTQLIGRKAGTSVGRDAGAIGVTTGLGAAIGAAAGYGRGAGIGAGAGAAAGLLGVLLTRGHPSIIYPEEALTFRVEAPFTVDTSRGAQAFRYVQPNEYNQPLYTQASAPPPAAASPAPAYAPPPPFYGGYPYGYGYPYSGYPGYGSSFSIFLGGGGYGNRWYGGPRGYGRGFGGGRGYYGGGRGWHR